MDTSTKLRDDTRDLLSNRPATLSIATIAEKTGIPESWLNTFRRGEIENPGVVTICKLNEFLTKHAKNL